MELHREVVDFHYFNIVNGFSPFLLKEQVLLAKHITPKEIFLANSYALLLRKKLKDNNTLSEYELLKDATSKGFWSHVDETDIKNIQKTIKQKQQILPNLVLPSQKKSVEQEIKKLNNDLNSILTRKNEILINSLENKVLNGKTDFMIAFSIFKSPDEKFWNNFEDYLNCRVDIVDEITKLYFDTMREIDTKVIRSVAKFTDARVKLRYTKNLSAKDLSVVFVELRQWCDFYDRIYELSDKPADNIIMDDDRLEGWILARQYKNQTQKSVNSSDEFTGIVGGTKEDMEILGGSDRENVLKVAQNNG